MVLRETVPPVVIVGAGPTGLVVALLLARYGVASLVLERHRRPYPLPRAVHVDDEVSRILQQVGLAAEFAAISRPAAGLRLLTAGHRVIAEFRRDRAEGVHGHPQSRLFDQPDLERLLLDRLRAEPLIELRTGVQVTGASPSGVVTFAMMDDDASPAPAMTGELRAGVVLACDGAGSTVRGHLGIGLDDLRFEQRWLVVDVRSATPPAVWDGVEQVCDPHRAATAMRIGPDRYRWEFRMHDGEVADDLAAPERLRRLLRPWTGDGPGSLQVLRAAEYTFRARVARRWRSGRVFLLGDAAHQTPPFIGQGLGSGLRDAHNLAWKLARVLAGGDGRVDDERLLASYQSEREPHARALVRLAVVAGWAMTGGQGITAALRRPLMAGLCRLPGATGLLLDRAGPPLTAGTVSVRRPATRRIRSLTGGDPAGHLVPQPWVRVRAPGGHGEGSRRMRLDDVLDRGFALLTIDPTVTDEADLVSRLGARVIRVADPGADLWPVPAGGEVVVESPELRHWLHGFGARAVVVRPDRVVLTALPRGG